MIIGFKRLSLRIICIAAIFLLTVGCSSEGIDSINPSEDTRYSAASHHGLWGLWQFVADPETQSLEYSELRTGGMHVNVVPLLEPPPLLNLTLEYLEFNGSLITCDIGLRHPFLGLTEFTGYDVCGILISSGSVTGFTDPDLRMAGEGDLRLLNPDGYTRWWNPSEFPNDGTMFGYTDGLLGAPDSFANYNTTLNGYKYFCDDLDADDDLSLIDPQGRGMFTPGQKNVRRYEIDLGEAGLIFNYAIDACWEFPQGEYPWVAPDDFSPNANRPEPYRLSISEIDKTLFYDPEEEMAEGEVTLLIDVYDWYDADLNTISVECGSIFTPLNTAVPIGGGNGYSTYQFDILDAQPTTAGPIDLFITAASADVGYQDLVPGKQVASYFKYVMDVPLGEIPQEFPCGDNLFEDDFDDYDDGDSLPDPPWWEFWDGVYGQSYVTNTQYYSPPNSWRSTGDHNWVRYDGYPMTRKDHFCYEARIMLVDTAEPARIGFAYKLYPNESRPFAVVSIGGDGFNTYQWYHVEVQVDCVENYYEYWIDDEFINHVDWDISSVAEAREQAFTHFIIGTTWQSFSGTSTQYFDDVKLYWDE